MLAACNCCLFTTVALLVVDVRLTLSCLQYYLNDTGVAALHAEYIRVAPHLKTLGDLKNRILSAVRNSRSHIASMTRAALAACLPNTRSAEGAVMVRVTGSVC